MRSLETNGRTSGHDSAGPDRRRFLLMGGSGVLAAAVLAACGSDEETTPGETGVTAVPPAETTAAAPQTTSPEEGAIQDAVVARTLRSFELAAAEVYAVLQGEGGDSELALPATINYDADVEDAFVILRDRHEAHAADLVSLVSDAGGERVTEPNNGVLDGLLEPRLSALTTQRSVLQFAYSLEEFGAGTYGWGTGTLTTPDLRETLMSIGSPAAGQATAVALLLDPSGQGAVPSGILDTSGPVRLPDHMLLQEDQDGGNIPAEAPAEGDEGSAGEEDEG